MAAGEQLGAMNDWQWKADLATAQERYEAAKLRMEASLAAGASQAGEDRAQMEYLRTEVERAQSRVESAELRSPIEGFVATPALQKCGGRALECRRSVCEGAGSVVGGDGHFACAKRRRAGAAGDRAVIKLDSYPQRTWSGRVSIVSPVAKTVNEERTFAARVPLGEQG